MKHSQKSEEKDGQGCHNDADASQSEVHRYRQSYIYSFNVSKEYKNLKYWEGCPY